MPGVSLACRYFAKCGVEFKCLNQSRTVTSKLWIVLRKKRERVEIFVACELFSFVHTCGKLLPKNNCFDGNEKITA